MTTTNTVTCGKCNGSGKFVFRTGAVEACYPCDGSGQVEPRALSPLPVRRADVASDLRAMYRNASKGLLSHADVLAADGMGWAPSGLSKALDAVSGSREAFRGLGWPV